MLGLDNTISSDYKPVFLDDYSLQFNGSDEYIQLSGTVGEIAQETGSVSVWVKGEAVSGSTTIFACSADSSNFIRIWWWNGQTKIAFTVKAGGTSLTATVSDTDFETNDAWHHIGVTWDFGAVSLHAHAARICYYNMSIDDRYIVVPDNAALEVRYPSEDIKGSIR